MIDWDLFRIVLMRCIGFVLFCVFAAFTVLSILASVFMMIGMLVGEWAFIHAAAMAGMAAGFAILAGLCLAVYKACGGGMI